MAHAPEKRAIVRAAYVHERLPIEMAAAKADVSERTAQRWKSDAFAEGDDWDKSRAVSHMAGAGFDLVITKLLGDYITLHESVTSQLMDKQHVLDPLKMADAIGTLADAFTKTMGGIGKASPKHMRLAVANDVLRMLGDYVRHRAPQHAAAFVEILEPFSAELAQQMS